MENERALFPFCPLSGRIKKMRKRIFRAYRSMRIKFPIKVQLRRTFIPLLWDACPKPPLPCKGEGVIQIGFLGNQFGI